MGWIIVTDRAMLSREMKSMSIGTGQYASKPKLPMGIEPRMLSFDVYGTLINTPPANLQAFRSILHEVSETNVDGILLFLGTKKRCPLYGAIQIVQGDMSAIAI